MPFRVLALVAAWALAAVACSGDDDESGDGTPNPTVASTVAPGTSTTAGADEDGAAEDGAAEGLTFTWVTTMDLDGGGYELVVAGTMGPDHADYTMQVSPFAAAGDGAGSSASIPWMAGAAVNGTDRPGAEPAVDNVDAKGFTEVIVVGGDRWYRLPWLLDEASFAMGDAGWVHERLDPAALPFIADLSGRVLVERYDDAVRSLRELVAAGDRIAAPPALPGRTELDELLTPWIGLVGPDARRGAPAVVEGDADAATVTWEQTLTYEPDGADGRLAGEVSWRRSPALRPEPPDPGDVVEVDDLADRLSEAG